MRTRLIFLFLTLAYYTDSYPKYRSVRETDIEETGGDYEGDILLTPETIYRGIGKKDPLARWPDGIVPYQISPDYDGYDRAKIISGMRRLERVVSLDPNSASFCIRFRPKTADDKYFISIVNGSGCSSYVGRIFVGGQAVTLQMKSYCVDREATIMHEFMHALGFWHEQSRPDRDNFVTIDLNNVQSGRENNFNKYSFEQTDTLDLPYDYNSVMHYSKTAFSVNGQPTIITKDPNAWIGQRNGLSAIDIQEIRRYYNFELLSQSNLTFILLEARDRVGGRKISAKHVIITVPLGCLKQQTITFQPSLPQWKLNAIDRLGFGNTDKIILQFDTSFWNDKWTILYLADAPFPFALCNPKKRILSFMIGGRRAQAMEDEKNETTVRQVMDSLKQAFAQQKFKLERYIISR